MLREANNAEKNARVSSMKLPRRVAKHVEMNRRKLLAGAAWLLGSGSALAAESKLRDAARDAYIYTSPLVEIANVRTGFFGLGAKPGRLYGRRSLSTPTSRSVTTPNNDTLNGMGFADLTNGPAKLHVPPLDGRYACLAILDMFSNNVTVLSPRNIRPQGGEFTLIGPGFDGSTGAIRSSTPWVWLIARVLVDGPDDVGRAASVLDGFAIEAALARAPAAGALRNADWNTYFTAADRLLIENPPPDTDAAMLARIAPLGLGSRDFDPGRFRSDESTAIAAGVADARMMIRKAGSTAQLVGGWAFEAPNTGDFGRDYETRARVALGGLGALPVTEALYLTAREPHTGRQLFSGDGPWCLRFTAGATPPVNAFWSLTMYQATDDGQFFLVPNSINRYSIGDRTPNLAHDADGALTIWISRNDPGGMRSANWLPAPTSGPFQLVLRAYEPRAELISRTYVPPQIILA